MVSLRLFRLDILVVLRFFGIVYLLFTISCGSSRKIVSGVSDTFPFDEKGNYRQDWVLLKERNPNILFVKSKQKSKKQIKTEQKKEKKRLKLLAKQQKESDKQRKKNELAYLKTQKKIQKEYEKTRKRELAYLSKKNKKNSKRKQSTNAINYNNVDSNVPKRNNILVADSNQSGSSTLRVIKTVENINMNKKVVKPAPTKPKPIPVKAKKKIVKSKGVKRVHHKVLKGDTLYSLSKKYNVSIEDIRRRNKIKGNIIITGSSIIIK